MYLRQKLERSRRSVRIQGLGVYGLGFQGFRVFAVEGRGNGPESLQDLEGNKRFRHYLISVWQEGLSTLAQKMLTF